PSCCPLATPRPCSSISTKSQRKSPPAHTPFSFSIKLDGKAPKTSRPPKTSRSCRCRRVRQSSTLKKTSGSSCGRTGCRTAFSNPSTKSSTTAATRGTRSSINPGKSCPSLAAIGQSPVNHCEGWYKYFPVRALSDFSSVDAVAKETWWIGGGYHVYAHSHVDLWRLDPRWGRHRD